MSLATGTRLGPYEILAPIGAGGAKTPLPLGAQKLTGEVESGEAVLLFRSRAGKGARCVLQFPFWDEERLVKQPLSGLLGTDSPPEIASGNVQRH